MYLGMSISNDLSRKSCYSIACASDIPYYIDIYISSISRFEPPLDCWSSNWLVFLDAKLFQPIIPLNRLTKLSCLGFLFFEAHPSSFALYIHQCNSCYCSWEDLFSMHWHRDVKLVVWKILLNALDFM